MHVLRCRREGAVAGFGGMLLGVGYGSKPEMERVDLHVSLRTGMGKPTIENTTDKNTFQKRIF